MSNEKLKKFKLWTNFDGWGRFIYRVDVGKIVSCCCSLEEDFFKVDDLREVSGEGRRG